MSGNEVDLIISNEIKFDYKPDAIPYQCRLTYKISIVVLILKLTSSSRGGTSLSKIHLISTYMYSGDEREVLMRYLKGSEDSYIVLRYDPLINKTIDFIVAEKLIIQQKNGLFKLTPNGRKYSDKLLSDDGILVTEKEYLNQIGENLSEQLIKNIERSLIG
ncbi:hypothetical protein [Listeria booriae]|uniref:hypothetical protein n=1 Tax=Listeria booriae TaxID=1552123 RepID=UPI0016284A8C|nr:hypothetical protein [Listeria booriae]MBC1235202.1 hypothetical protein [Listeria booriae]